MYFLKDNYSSFDYVDGTFLHVTHSLGMSSFHMSRKNIDELILFLRRAYMCTSDDNDFRDGKIGKYTVSFDGPDEERFNILISTKEMLFVFNLERSEIGELIEELMKPQS